MAEEKSLHRMPSADCWDYAEIPLLVQACLSEDVSKRIARMPSADLGIRGGRAQRGRCPRILFIPSAACWDYAEIIVRGNAEIRNPPPRKPVGRLGHSRWASAARSVPSNPLKANEATPPHLWCHYFGKADFTARNASHQHERKRINKL